MIDTPIAAQAWDALRRHVLVPLVPRCIDEEYGGFLVDFDDRWRPAGPQDKTLEHAVRTTIAFAEIDRAMTGQGYERSMRHGRAFPQQAMWDGAYGGFFARVDRSGRPQWEGAMGVRARQPVRRAPWRDPRAVPRGGNAMAASSRAPDTTPPTVHPTAQVPLLEGFFS